MRNKRPNIALGSRSIILLAIVASFFAAYDLSEATDQVQTRVRGMSQAQVKGEKIYLGDIADIEGPAQLRKQLGAICVANAPGPGGHKTLHGRWIENKVRSKRWLPANTALIIPESVRVDRTSQSIPEDRFLGLYTSYIGEKLAGRKADFRVSRFRVIGNGPIPDGDTRIEFSSQTDDKLMGQVSLNAFVRVHGKIERRVVLSGWVDRFEEVVFPRRPLNRHSVLTEDDLSVEKRNVSRLPKNVIKTMAHVVGKRLRRPVRAGTALLGNMVEQPPLIEKGDRVTVVAESPTLTVTVPGIAQGKGFAGEHIRVRNSMSKKEVLGRILNASTVAVDF
jgi:flagella basal body P-ring formation protein FlgA